MCGDEEYEYMRTMLTKRLLKEGLLRILEKETLSKISISELCEESGINRGTFYKHYESPAMILRDIAYDYDRQMSIIYETTQCKGGNEEDRIEACMQFLLEKKAEIKILSSPNAEYSLNRFGLEIVNEKLSRRREMLQERMQGDSDEHFLYAVATASAPFGLLEVWLTMDINKNAWGAGRYLEACHKKESAVLMV